LTSNGSQGIHLLTRQSGVEICDRFSAEHEPLYKLCRVLFERITEAVVNHETDDWPRYYDRLSALICKVIAKSEHRREVRTYTPSDTARRGIGKMVAKATGQIMGVKAVTVYSCAGEGSTFQKCHAALRARQLLQ
jgi:hypothetical protein